MPASTRGYRVEAAGPRTLTGGLAYAPIASRAMSRFDPVDGGELPDFNVRKEQHAGDRLVAGRSNFESGFAPL